MKILAPPPPHGLSISKLLPTPLHYHNSHFQDVIIIIIMTLLQVLNKRKQISTVAVSLASNGGSNK